jgi:ribosomal protein L11 methylase PrmA
VADVGCGSGILAIAAARLGAVDILATDVDPLAVDATGENIAANRVGDSVHVELEPGEIGIPEWENNARPGLAAARQVGQVTAAAGVPSPTNEAASAQRATPNGATGGGFGARGAAAFDLLVANILAETLVEMRDALASAVRPGGTLVLSGIEARRLKMVEEAFIRPPWCLARTVTRGEWVSLSLHHTALAEPTQTPSVLTQQAGPPGAT